MKRILFMHQSSSIGGGSYCLLNIIKALDRSLFCPIVVLKNEGPLVRELQNLSVQVILFPQMAAVPYNCSLWKLDSLTSYYSVWRSLRPFSKLLVSMKPDVLYLNNMMVYPYLRKAKELGIETVLHVREHWPLDEHKIQLEWARRNVYNYADKIIAINRYSASMFPKKEATIVYDWIDMDGRYKFYPFDEIFGEDSSKLKVYLFTGGFLPIKGVREVVRAFTQIVKGDDRRLLLLGVNDKLPKGIMGVVKKMLYKLGIPTYGYDVKLMIHKDHRIVCIPAIYNLKHIIEQSYCVLSYFTIPHANLGQAESIVLGTPVVAAKTAESLEYSLEGELSMLYEINDYEAFCNAIKKINLNASELKKKIKEKGTEVKDMFCPKRNARVLNDYLMI